MSSEGGDRSRLTLAVTRARRRFFTNRALAESAAALAIALLGPTTLLVAGWGWFAAPLLAIFAAAGIGISAWRLWRRQPGLYQVSQLLDARLAAQDQISTAMHFLDAVQPAAVEQRHVAAGIAERSDPEAVFPLTLPRSAYGLAGVFLLASVLLGVRYWLEKPLQLARPLPAVLWQALNGADPDAGEPEPQLQAEQRRQRAAALEGEQQTGEERGRQPAASNQPPSTDNQPPTTSPDAEGDAPSDSENGDVMAPGDEDLPIQSYEDMLERDAQSGLKQAEGKQGNDGDANGEPKDGANGANDAANSLLAKLQEAFRNMLSKMQQKAPKGAGEKMAAAGSLGEAAEQQDGKGEARSGAGQAQGAGQKASDEGGTGAKGEAADPNAAGKDGKAQGDARGDSGQGAGSQEGDKKLRDALQQEAMGKLSELYGRRAASVAGEITVQAESGKQTLRTPLSARSARHADSGGAVTRDEIPLAYQSYIKEYFEKARQASPKK